MELGVLSRLGRDRHPHGWCQASVEPGGKVTVERDSALGFKDAQYLTFTIGGEEYAIAILGICEIVDCSSLQEVPGAPAHMRGVVRRGGDVVPVMDLALGPLPLPFRA